MQSLPIRCVSVMCFLALSARADDGWFDFRPNPEIAAKCEFDLRSLNEKFAGEHGRIIAKDGKFIHSGTREPVRFWAVNGPPEDLRGEELARCARMLARYGVNLVRVHTAMFNKAGEPDAAKVLHAQEIVAAMKLEGIYTHFSIYFPLWFRPSPDLPWLEGYDGQKHPFAALMFNPEFQKRHRAWFQTLLTTPVGNTGKTLADDPAVFGVEIQNEDSYFFWTFDQKNVPDPQLRIFEKRFGDWLIERYGSIDAALARWKGQKLARDVPFDGRTAFRPLWNIANERTVRDQDTAAFLLEAQSQFYRETYAFLRQLGFDGLITCSNWATASPEVFGPLEKLSYTIGDFVDRHGYFECNHKGENAAWSIRNGHTYSDRSALRFDGAEPSKSKQFVHPVIDPQYADKPSMISETTFTRPNRYRTEAPLYYAAYGALQDTDCVVHFAFDGADWQVKPPFWMQQWTLATPGMMGQFPAAALVYRQGLVREGEVLAHVHLNQGDLRQLKGTPLPQDAAFDELRLKDVPQGTTFEQGQRLDPLLHYAGRSQVTFTNEPGRVELGDLSLLIDRKKQTVTSSTRELQLDFGQGLLRINAAGAQGASGALRSAGSIDLMDLTISSDLDLAHIVAVALDDKPLKSSGRILLQAISEERTSGFASERVDATSMRITNIGRDPWQVKELRGKVSFKRSDARNLRVTRLDASGVAVDAIGTADAIELRPSTIYYLIGR